MTKRKKKNYSFADLSAAVPGQSNTTKDHFKCQ